MNIKIIVTLGPSTSQETDLKALKEKGVDFVRVNMSHSSPEDLEYFIKLSKKVGLPFIIDTEGSQIRTGKLYKNKVNFNEGDEIKIFAEELIGDENKISLKPCLAVKQLEDGDLIYVDFDTLVLRVLNTATLGEGYVVARVITGGALGNNKGIVVDSQCQKKIELPTLSSKDFNSIALGLKEGVEHVAASFMRSGQAVEEVRQASHNSMKIISKIECLDALENLDEIIDKSDYLLIDRGDLSKEVPIEKIPFIQKIILHKAQKKNKEVFVATNLLETMIENRKPTRAEVHDIIETIVGGANGLTLAAETAIGKHPMECVNMLKKLIRHASLVVDREDIKNRGDAYLDQMESQGYLLNDQIFSSLPPPHGGRLVDKVLKVFPDKNYLKTLPKIIVNENIQMDLEQIAFGVFSPLEGFMGREDFLSVLDNMKLVSGEIWPLPIILDVSEKDAENLNIGQEVILADQYDRPLALLALTEKYNINKEEMAIKLYGTKDQNHPGVKHITSMGNILLAGPIKLIQRRVSSVQAYEMTPRQSRRLFEDRGWAKVVGFHTRNVIHKSHEFIQMKAMEQECCDGLFVHPVVGKKKSGDFNAKYIIESYELMNKYFYPKDKVIFSVFSTYSRYAGPREAVFTAICRKNFGCSHFIVGRDHTGVGNFYSPKASHLIFDKLPDLGIKIVKFDNVFYSQKTGEYIHEAEIQDNNNSEKLHISGTEARKMLCAGIKPPEWFMRPEISNAIVLAVAKGEEVFVGDQANKKGKVLWFTGLSGSGKTTIALKLKEKLNGLGKEVRIIDGDTVRNTLNRHLGFSREDIKENNRLIAVLAKEETIKSDYILVPVISPFRADRLSAKNIIGLDSFIELFVDCPVEECIVRDTKGLYKKTLAGQMDNLVGVSNGYPYEAPENPHIHLHTHQSSINDCVEKIERYLSL